MPQVRCPNCGTTINLENRRKVDFGLILRALKSSSKTFTELLRITHLPRKTLALRLKALLKSGRIEKKKGGYHLNGSVNLDEWNGKLNRHVSLGRKQILLMILLFIIGLPIAAHVYAVYTSSPPPSEPIISETFSAEIVVQNVEDLYAWQVAVAFDPDVLTIMNVTEGDFLDIDFPFMAWSDDSYLGRGKVLMGATLYADMSGVSGSGTLATIEFGVIGEGSRELQLLDTYNNETVLLLYDPAGTMISEASVTIET